MSPDSLLVHLVESYEFPDADNPARQVHVNNLHCLGARKQTTEREHGVFGFKVAVPADVARGLPTVPGWYEPVWREQPNRKTGKYERRCIGMEFIGPAEGFAG